MGWKKFMTDCTALSSLKKLGRVEDDMAPHIKYIQGELSKKDRTKDLFAYMIEEDESTR